jgi:hypothetical protein
LRFLAIDLAKNFAQNPSICLFLEPPATISARSKTPKTVSLSGGSLVKKRYIILHVATWQDFFSSNRRHIFGNVKITQKGGTRKLSN